MSSSIPSINLQDYLSQDNALKSAFISELGKAYEEFGFVTVYNHGISDDLVNRYYKKVEQFFSLPEEQKRNYEIVELAGQRGYTSFGREHAKGSEAPDLKEFWQLGQEIPADHALAGLYPPNVFIKEIEGFTEDGISLFQSFEKTGAILLRAIADYLKLDTEYFSDKIEFGNSILRAIHYPPITAEPASSIRAERHEDINLITLLVGASADGLQLLNKQGEWLNIKAPEGHIVVNVGDMLQRLTNNVLSSTTHRVVNPPRELWHTHRYSIPFFLHPKSEMDLTCLPSCVSDANPLAYQPITAGAYLEERLIEIGLLKK